MQIKLPQPFFFQEGKEQSLLHGFTGNSSDVRQLGRFLQKGYTFMRSMKVMLHRQKKY